MLTSATIGNPEELATSLMEQKVHLIDQDGYPRDQLISWSTTPPLVDEKLGIRKSSIDFARDLYPKLMKLLTNRWFLPAQRRTVEMLLTYLRSRLPVQDRESVRGYRSGYLKSERREIEHGLKSGSLKAVFRLQLWNWVWI